MFKKFASALVTSLVLLAGANAQILTAFDVAGTGGTAQGPGTPSQTTDASVTATTLARTTVLFASGNNSFNSNTWNTTANLNTATNYISFDVTAGAAPVTFSTLQFAINGSNTAPNTGTWAYTLDSGTSFTLGTTANGGAFTTAFAAPTALATWDFTDFTLASGSTVEFRFFEYGATAINAGSAVSAGGTTRISNIAGNDLVLNGPGVAGVPEPTTLAALVGALGLLSLVIYRRNSAA